MATFNLAIEASVNTVSGNAPLIEILVAGVVVGSFSVTALTGSSTTLYEESFSFTGNFPSSLSYRFAASSGDGGDVVTLDSVRINGQAIAGGNLTATILNQGQQAIQNMANTDHLFGRVEPTAGDLGTVTESGTGGNDEIIGQGDGVGDVIDAGGGDDYVALRDDDDAVIGGDGDDRLFGQGGNDILLGGNGNDNLFGNDGDDLLYGQANNDVIRGGAGNDTISGGTGDDRLFGDAGNDILFGGDGADLLAGVSGNNFLYGDAGNDSIFGGRDNDTAYGGADDDVIHGANGDDTLYGEAGDDFMTGGNGADTIDGGADDDYIHGDDGADNLSGGTGADNIYGGDGDDTVNGDDGNDYLNGGAGADTINGGIGNDIIHGHGLDNRDISSILRNNPGVLFSEETGSFYQFVNSSLTWSAAQTAAQGTTISGVAGHLVAVTSDAENEYIYQLGLANGATSSTGSGGQRVWLSAVDEAADQNWYWTAGLEAGIQFSNVGTPTNNMYENWGGGQPNNSGGNQTRGTFWFNGTNTWDDRNDTDTHDYVIEWESGLFSDDNAADILSGGAGDDWLYGFGGDDTLNGDADNDILFGMAGSDTLNGGTGNDVLYAFDGTVETASAIIVGNTVTILNQNFAASAGAFSYADGGFGGSDGANVVVNGNYITGDGAAANGALEVDIVRSGGTFSNASGNWSTSVSHTADLSNVQISFAYRHWHASQNDTGEDSQVWFEFDGVRYDQSGGNSFISEALGSGGTTDTGWVTVTIDLPDLTSSTAYNLSIGILHLGATANNEDAYVRIDDVVITGDEPAITGPPTTNNADIGEANILNGGDGNDTLYGSAGNDTLNGDAGADTIYSASANEAWDTAIANILSSNSNLSYSADTNSFYRVVSSTVDWTDANTAANAATLTGLSGVNGHLATITSAAEQTFLEGLTGGASAWIGGGDFGTEGIWRWTAGPEAGAQFANSTGGAVNGWYNSWTGGQPNDSNGTQDYLYMLNGTDWADLVNEGDGSTGFVTVPRYVIEWDAQALISTVDITTINGGSGADTLYGNDGIDIFVFEAATWDAVDTIENFSAAGRDALDISDILSGFDYINDNINNFISLSVSGGNTTVAVDAAGGASFSNLVILNGVTGLDLHQMISADNLIV